MALAYFDVERGFSVENSAFFIQGSGAPGSSGDSTTVPAASLYVDTATGNWYRKATAGSGTDKWELLADNDTLSALQTEVDNIETSLGSVVNSSGVYQAFSGSNHLDAETSITGVLSTLDSEIGPHQTAVSRTYNPIVNSASSNSNIGKLDTAIGPDSHITSTNYISTGNSVYAMLSALDAGIQTALSGIDPKESCDCATTIDLDSVGNGTWTQLGSGVGATLTAGTAGTTTIDGVLLADGDRVLVKDQGTGSENGIYVASDTGAGNQTVLTRATDFDGSPANEVSANAFTFIEEGTSNADKGFVLTTNDPITVDTTALTFSVFSSAGGLGALQTEVDAIETSLGSAISASGTYTGHSGTNHLDGATSFTNALELLDTEIGADVSAVTRTNNPIVNGNPVNSNIDALDAAVGADADLTPVSRTTGPLVVNTTVMAKFDAIDTAVGADVSAVSRTTGPISTGNSVNANIDALDTAIGADLTANTRTNNPVVASNTVNANLEALDDAIGADADLTPVSRTAGPVVVNSTVMAKFDALDTAIGADLTANTRTNNPVVVANDVNSNLEALDDAIGADSQLTSTNVISTSNSIYQNLAALDAAVDNAGTQTTTAVSAATQTTCDTVLVDSHLAVYWLVHIRDGSNFLSALVYAMHDNIPSGADASNTDHTVSSKLRVGTVAGEAITVDLNGTGASQEMRLRVTTTNASTVNVLRFTVEA